MRITSVSAAYNRQNLRPQNVSFGKFENKETKQYVRENILNPDQHGGPAKVAFDYFDKSDLFTIKHKKGVVYVVAERNAIDKHKNKGLIEDMILSSYRRLSFSVDRKNLTATEKNIIKGYGDEAAINAGIVKAEPNYLTAIEDFGDAHNLFENFVQAENGYDPSASDPVSFEEEYEPDNWDKAHDWMKN